MRTRVPSFLVCCLLALVLAPVLGCKSDSDSRSPRDRSGRNIERELERAQNEIETIQKKLEEQLDRKLTEEELEKIGREAERNIEKGLVGVGEALERIGTRIKEDSNVKVVDYRDFKSLLEDTLEGMDLIGVQGSNKNALGIRFSKLEAQYEDERDGRVMEVTILDLGTMKGITSLGFDWVNKEVDNENLDGYEKTTKFGGFPGFESAQYLGPTTKMQGVAIVENRFVVVVNVEGKTLDKEIMDNIFDDFPLRRLARMAD